MNVVCEIVSNFTTTGLLTISYWLYIALIAIHLTSLKCQFRKKGKLKNSKLEIYYVHLI